MAGRLIRHPSPNYGARRGGASPDLVVLHYTGMANAGAALARLCEPSAAVSAHYLVDETGTTFQLVEEAERAWHAGAGRWGRVDDVNSRSIGIELVNTGAHPFPAPQMAALEALLYDVMTRRSIPPARVIGHSDMAPARKSDPGARFDWGALARAGLAVWPAAEAGGRCGDPARFATDAAAFGYDTSVGSTWILRAFRLRFRPWAAARGGAPDAVDAALAADLARRFPVDQGAATA
ncbi:N-acetylmuramoyl-L-alanine amidase [Roseovarius salinarum]|uniref:N-acetylmuramoyl-L-alanine amidase n=1 Tax=Roseovarius salinarum TaxID=1981892 RepID=UPI001E45D26B|nr:N-acetylmuramoyl-L-alanine amidase [Roseovarius salinarum]